jgi:hypothetical protein
MRKRAVPPRYPNKYLVVGFAAFLTGGILLLWNLGYLPGLALLWPLGPLLIGMFVLYRAYLRGGRDRFLLPWMFLTLYGLQFLLLNTVFQALSLARVWPSFMFVAGISLMPFAMRRKGNARVGLLVPALFLCLLAILFFPFSLGRVGFSLVQFVGRWWPAILILAGLSLMTGFFVKKRTSKPQ